VTHTSSANRFAGLDHLRALAIILVFIYHSGFIGGRPASLDGIVAFGWTGVDLFFVLSGYLIGGQLLARIARHQSISYGEFYIKRSMRILPAYLVVLALYFLIPAFRERSELPPLWRFLTFTQNYGLDLTREGAFSHAWSLCIEEQFYLGLPLFILALTAIGPAHRSVWVPSFGCATNGSAVPAPRRPHYRQLPYPNFSNRKSSRLSFLKYSMIMIDPALAGKTCMMLAFDFSSILSVVNFLPL
jgi:peptidoglycan/LPS O-acetylase OafA/YrhL